MNKRFGKKSLYVLGFAFDSPEKEVDVNTKVALIRKSRPDWQKGILNGIGGHIEKGENPLEAQIREFKEETGLLIPKEKWLRVTSFGCLDWNVTVFKAFDIPLHKLRTCTDEEVIVFNAFHIPFEEKILFNLRWLIPMCLDPDMPHSDIIEYN